MSLTKDSDLTEVAVSVAGALRRSKIRAVLTGGACASATDSVRDRLAAFYHWNDPQSLSTALEIALRHRVDMKAIRAWSVEEGSEEGFLLFVAGLKRKRA